MAIFAIVVSHTCVQRQEQWAAGTQTGYHFNAVSSFSEYVVVPQEGAVKIPDDILVEIAAVLGCAVVTGVGAVERTARVRLGESVAVIGCGGVGLNVIQ